MFRNRSSNTLRCLPRASDSVAPASTSRVTSPIIRPNDGLLDCLARMSRHWTSGSPAEIMVANWRVKIARSLVLTPLPRGFGILKPLPLGRTEVTRIRFLRSASRASSARATSISPAWDSPASVRPFQTKTGMVCLSRYAANRELLTSICSSSVRSVERSMASSGLSAPSSTAWWSA